MDAINAFLWTPLGAMPLIIWLIFGFCYTFGMAFPQFLFGAFFYKYIWNKEQMAEILGEEEVRRMG